MERAEEFEGVLSSTADALEASGYDLQVPIMPSGVNLFLEGPAGRERIYRDGDDFRLRRSGEATCRGRRSVRLSRQTRAVLSPNVLLRPVVESTIFPTLAYVGGPGEMAYFAQLRAYFEAHDMEMPIVFPRFGATIVETKIRKVLTKFNIDVESLNRPFHEIATEMAREGIPDEVRRRSPQAARDRSEPVLLIFRRLLLRSIRLSRDRSSSCGVPPSPALDDVEKKVTQAVKRESEIKLSQLEKAQLHLFPNGKPRGEGAEPDLLLKSLRWLSS